LTKEKKLSHNSARASVASVSAFFSFFGFTMKISGDIFNVEVTTSDFVPSIEEYRQLFNCGDLRARVLISMGLDLAWRIGDVLSIKKNELPNLDEAPTPFERRTAKEKVLAKSFLSTETCELLKSYLPTLKPENEFLFQNGNGSNIEGQTANDVLKTLAVKAKLRIPQNKRIRFHCFRKRFLSTCADLRIDPNIAKILVGKEVSPDMLTYLGEATLKDSWSLVKAKLTLTNGTIKKDMESKDARIGELTQRLEETQRLIKAMTELFGEEILEKAQKKLGVFASKKTGKPLEPLEALELIAELKRKQEQEEYEKLLAENNNNHET
jgi:integrase